MHPAAREPLHAARKMAYIPEIFALSLIVSSDWSLVLVWADKKASKESSNESQAMCDSPMQVSKTIRL